MATVSSRHVWEIVAHFGASLVEKSSPKQVVDNLFGGQEWAGIKGTFVCNNAHLKWDKKRNERLSLPCLFLFLLLSLFLFSFFFFFLSSSFITDVTSQPTHSARNSNSHLNPNYPIPTTIRIRIMPSRIYILKASDGQLANYVELRLVWSRSWVEGTSKFGTNSCWLLFFYSLLIYI